MTEQKAQNIGNKIKRDRSAAYPAIPLREAVEISSRLIETYPRAPFDRTSAALSMGYKTLNGASAPKVAALVYYGLLERKGNVYKNSDLARRISHYSTEEEKAESIMKAVKNPKLFESLILEYSGLALPQTLNNILVRQYDISPKVADAVVQIFKDSLEFANMYSNGIVNEGMSHGVINHKNLQEGGEGGPSTFREVEANGVGRQAHAEMVDVELPSGIILSYPADIAYLFAIGKFGEQIAALDKAILDSKLKDETTNGDQDISATK